MLENGGLVMKCVVEPRGKPQGLMFWLNLREPPSSLPRPEAFSSLILPATEPHQSLGISFHPLEQSPVYPGFIIDSQCPRQVNPPPSRSGCGLGSDPVGMDAPSLIIPAFFHCLRLHGEQGELCSLLLAWLINKCHFQFMLSPHPLKWQLK